MKWVLSVYIGISVLGIGLSSKVKPITWDLLSEVTYEKKYLEEEDLEYWHPKFGPTLEALEGQLVSIAGYVIPVDVEADYYVLSSNPFASCFFCGGAGPETVMELRLNKNTKRFKTDEYLTFSGKLKLNADNLYELNYILEEAKLEN